MKSVRTAVAAAALSIAVVPVTLAGCGSQPAAPAATPSSTPTATAPVSPATTPAPTQTPGPGATSPAPSIRVISSRLAYPWHWPNEPARPGRVVHSYPVPPMPELVQISVGHHPEEHGQLPYSRMSFTFTRAFPSYHFEWVTQLVSDASGKVVPLRRHRRAEGRVRPGSGAQRRRDAVHDRLSAGSAHRLPEHDRLSPRPVTTRAS